MQETMADRLPNDTLMRKKSTSARQAEGLDSSVEAVSMLVGVKRVHAAGYFHRFLYR
jgi:hypothetical protein